MKHFKILRALWKIRLQNLMMFRLGFWGPFFVDGSLFLVQLAVFDAIYANVDQIGSWGRGEMILYIGTFSLINAVNMVVYFFGVNGIVGKIKSGEMDFYLSKPVSPLFRLTFERMNPGSIPLLIFSIGIIGYGLRTADIQVTGERILVYLFYLILMIVLYYEMEVLIRSIAFYLVSNARMEQLEEMGLELCMNLPGIAFYGVYKVIFYGVLPYGIMATLPVQSLIGEMSPGMAVHGAGTVCLFGGITAFVWKNGMRHYNSASS
jgi:ABC-2 type transport system permease protein